MRKPIIVSALLAALALPLSAAEPIDPEVLAVREAAWRAWFGGDEAALRTLLPENFLAISTEGSEISDRDKTIANSRAFKQAGGHLVSLTFPETRAQRYGDTIVLYGTYDAEFAVGDKEPQHMRG